MLRDGETPKHYRTTTFDDYLIDCQELKEGETLYIRVDWKDPRFRIPPSLADMDAALLAQWGTLPYSTKPKFTASSHGSARYVKRAG